MFYRQGSKPNAKAQPLNHIAYFLLGDGQATFLTYGFFVPLLVIFTQTQMKESEYICRIIWSKNIHSASPYCICLRPLSCCNTKPQIAY